MTAELESRAGGVRVQASRHCEVVLSGADECEVLDRLAAWAREHYADITIVGLHHVTEWGPDPDGVMPTDECPSYVVTMQFKTGGQLGLEWGRE